MSVTEYFSADGALSRVLPGYSMRSQQLAMAEAVERTVEQGGILVAEAGTGVGKTFAYLVPAIHSGKRVIIATGTKNLQDQLFHDDLPLVRNALGISVSVALLKGRANYLCAHRLQMNLAAGGRRSHRHQHEMELIRDWAGRTSTGDIAEMDDVEEGSFVWPLVTSTTENCIGQDCDDYNECYVLKARRLAQAADIVVINHHLLFADMALKEKGFGDILPGADVFIIDEAHQLPEVAGDFFGFTVTSRQIHNLITDAQSEHIKQAGGLNELPDAMEKLEKALADLRLCMGGAGQRLSWQELQRMARFTDLISLVESNLSELCDWLATAAERGKELDSCYRRSLNLLSNFRLMHESTDSEQAQDDAADQYVRWADTTRRGFGLHSTPLNIAEIFQTNIQEMQANWIFTSATLAVADSFRHFTDSLGLDSPVTQLLGSPFDYQSNGLKYIPHSLPEPADPAYTRAVCTQSLPVIEAAGGRTFLLFTSHRALQAAAEFMHDHLDYPILVQGEAPKQRLLKDFKEHGNAVLLGTSSFWEGVDVRGPALSCVIIDKLPFASPGDPVMQARLDAMKKRGQNPFFDYQVPSAVVTLKQGVGRLIRDVTDSGVLVLCDPRLLSKGYGKIFLRSLPEMPLTRNIEDVFRFFQQHETV